jgi:hypothetical protein
MIKTFLKKIRLFRFIDEKIYKFRLYIFIKRIQIKKNNSVYEDRKEELMDYYKVRILLLTKNF